MKVMFVQRCFLLFFSLLVLPAALIQSVHAEEAQKRHIKVLFIRNSHTGGMPIPLAELINTTSKTTEIEVDRAVKGGSYLLWHWNDTGRNDVVNRIKTNPVCSMVHFMTRPISPSTGTPPTPRLASTPSR